MVGEKEEGDGAEDRKGRVVYSTIYIERRNEYEHTTIRIAMIALGVSVIATIVNLIVSFL